MRGVGERTSNERKATSRANKSSSTIAMDGLRRIVGALRRADAVCRATGGIPSAQLFVLRQLGQKPASSIGDLRQATLTSQSSVSEVVARLEGAGLIRRTRATDDARRVELSLTQAGRKVLDESPEPFQEKLVAALNRMPLGDRHALATGITRWLEEAGIGDAPATMFFEPDHRA